MYRYLFVLMTFAVLVSQTSFGGEGYWETHGPYGGYINRVEYDCGTPGLCYAGGENGFFRSEDGGLTWQRSVPVLPADDIYTFCFCASRSVEGLVFAHIGDFDDYSLFKSVDAGITWEGISAPWGSQLLSAIACDPNDANHICVAVYDTFELGRLFRTLDGGATWEMVFTGTRPSAVCIDPRDPQTIWIGCVYASPKRTVNGGLVWQDLPYGLNLSYFWPQGIYVSPTDSSDVFLSGWGLYRWDQQRFTWTDVGVRVYDICFFRDDPSLMYACYPPGLYCSTEGGDTWTLRCNDYGGRFIDVSPFDHNDVIIGSDSGVCRSMDGCSSARFSSNGMIAQDANQLFVCGPEMDTLVVAGSFLLAKSTDAALGWEINDYFRDIFSIRVGQDPNDRSVLYEASPFEDIIQVSHNSGEDWEFFCYWPGGQWDWCQDIAVDPSDSRRIYVAVGSDAIYRTENLGFTWQRLSNFVGASTSLITRAVAIDPGDPDRVFVCTSEDLFLSTNHGDSFLSVEDLPIEAWLIEFDPVDSSVIYASETWRSGGLYRSLDSGKSWDKLQTPVELINDMAFNPTDGNDFYISGYKGVHHTRDRGKTWTSLSTQGLQCSSTTAIVVDFGEAGNTVHAACAAVFSYFEPFTPIVGLCTSDTEYRVGDMIHIGLDLVNPGDGIFADLAVAVGLPNGMLVYLPSLWTSYSPFYSGWIPGQFSLSDYTLLEAPVDAGLPSGMYCAYAALLEQGTMTYVSNLATCQFRITTSR